MILRFFRLVGALLSFLCSGFMSLTLVSSGHCSAPEQRWSFQLIA